MRRMDEEKKTVLGVDSTENGMAERTTGGESVSYTNCSTDSVRKQGRIEAILPCGAAHAVPAKMLAAQLGFRSVRQLQTAVHAERNAGAVILTKTDGGGGFYRPAANEEGRAEIVRFIRTLDSRARHTKVALRSARAALRECENQIEMEG